MADKPKDLSRDRKTVKPPCPVCGGKLAFSRAKDAIIPAKKKGRAPQQRATCKDCKATCFVVLSHKPGVMSIQPRRIKRRRV